MDHRSRIAFLLLVLFQSFHSFEEYIFRLYEVFAPARFLSGLFPDGLRFGFIVINAAFVAFGLWCYVARVRPNHASARLWVGVWSVIELGNGIGHILMALTVGGYFPGVATAPLLLLVAAYLAIRLLHMPRVATS